MSSRRMVHTGGFLNEQGENQIDVDLEGRCRETEEALSEVPSSSDPRKASNGIESEIRRKSKVVRLWGLRIRKSEA